jgi:type I restriction enzyme S subunit
MTGERRYIPASEFCASVRDGTHDSPKPVQNGRKLVTSRHLTTGRLDLTDAYLISEEDFEAINKRSKVDRWDVLISMIGTVGEPCLIKEEPDFAIKNIGLFKTKSEADGKWLYYFLRSKDAQQSIREQSRGTTQQYIPLGALRDFPILVADDPEEKKAIAAVLGALDDKIELNRRMNATLEAMARALFQSWFVDFDPVRAKLDGRSPAVLDPATAALFPASFDETAAGHVPHGWHIGSIYEIANVIYGAPFASSLFNSDKCGKPLIRIRDLPGESPAVFTTEVHPKGYLLQPGDIAVGMDGEFRAYLWAGQESWLNQRVCVFAPKPGYSTAFVRNSIMAPLAEVEATETATTVIHLGKNDIDRFTVVIPGPPIAGAFKRQCQPWYDQIVANKQQSRILATLRDTLLPKLLSGELSLRPDHV